MDSMWVSGTQDAGSIPARATSSIKNPSIYWGFFNLESILVSVNSRNSPFIDFQGEYIFILSLNCNKLIISR